MRRVPPRRYSPGLATLSVALLLPLSVLLTLRLLTRGVPSPSVLVVLPTLLLLLYAVPPSGVAGDALAVLTLRRCWRVLCGRGFCPVRRLWSGAPSRVLWWRR